MHLSVTIKSDDDLEELQPLLAAVRQAFSQEQLTILEAPPELNYGYPFPILTISEEHGRRRLFGEEAIEHLREHLGALLNPGSLVSRA